MNNEKFKMYLEIRDSGLTNMFDVKAVVGLSEGVLTREDCFDIMQNFERYMEIHNKIQDGGYNYLWDEV